MFCTVRTTSGLQAGDVVSWSGSEFALSSSLATPLGVLVESSTLDADDNFNYAPVTFAGVAWGRCSRDIPQEGGELQVENGRVYVDNSANGAGIIAPLPKGQAARVAGDLVMIHIR